MARAAFQFDLSQINITDNAKINSAFLSVYRINAWWAGVPSPETLDRDGYFMVHTITLPWTESTAKWNNIGVTITSIPEDTFSYQKGYIGWMDFDITDAISKIISGTAQNYGFMVTAYTNTDSMNYGITARLHSSESTEKILRPKLTISYDNTAVEKIEYKQNKQHYAKIVGGNRIAFTVPANGRYQLSIVDVTGRVLKKITNIECSKKLNIVFVNNISIHNRVLFVQITGVKYKRNGKLFF